MLEWLHLVSECVGVLVVFPLLYWLGALAISKLRPRPLLDRLSTRAVLITGCDSGFGHQLARRLDALGVPVFAGCLLPEGPGARSLAADCSSKLHVLPLDVTSDQQVADAVVSVKAALKDSTDTGLWAVVNNAGITDFGEMENTPLEKFQQVLDINTIGAVRVSKAFIPLLKESKGRVINVNSPGGRFQVPWLGPYCMSKSALIMFTDILRMEVKKWGITVSSIEPLMYRTPIANVECLESKHFDNTEKTLLNEKDSIREETRENCAMLLRGGKWFCKENISEVVDEMVIASVGRDVQRRYMVGFKDTIIVNLASILPDCLREFVIVLIYMMIVLMCGKRNG